MEVVMPGSRIARRIGIDRNPLRRRSDRVEAWLRLVVLTTVLLAAPFVVWGTSHVAYRNAVAAAQRELHQTRYRVTAVLLEDATGLYYSDTVRPQPESVQARWTAPDGTPRTGQVLVPSPANAGSEVRVWTNRHGDLADPPESHDPVSTAVTAGLAAFAGLGAVAACLLLVIRLGLNRRRMAIWQTEWIIVEPRWSGRR
jgi:hypothetical protein